MAFWIFVGVIAVILTLGIISSVLNEDIEVVGWSMFGAIGVAFLGLMVCGIGAAASSEGTLTLQKTWALRALVTQTQTESHASAVFFLGFGYASSSSSDVKTVSYIQTARDGGSTLQKANIDDSVIYEDGGDNPRVEDWVTIRRGNGMFVPWDFTYESGTTEHRFHIPAGSILTHYEVIP